MRRPLICALVAIVGVSCASADPPGSRDPCSPSRSVFTRNVGDPVRVEYDGVLVVRFAPDGRCSEHREWYFRRELPG